MSDHCVFCKIIRKEIPSKAAYEDDQILAIHDIEPAAPIHVLLIPKEHVDSVADIPKGDSILSLLSERAVQLAESLGCSNGGYRLVINHGDNGGQTVFHLHLHLLGGRFMAWPPG